MFDGQPENEHKESPQEPKRSLLGQAAHEAVGLAWGGNSEGRSKTENLLTQFTSVVPLFVGGRFGYAGSALLTGLNSTRIGDTRKHQLEDFALGGAKGLTTKASFDYFGKRDWNFALKGIAMGTSSRTLEAGMSRHSYLNDNGNLDLSAGVKRTATTALSLNSLLTDVAVFGAATGAAKIGSKITGGAIDRKPLAAAALTGASFGFTSGAIGEIENQQDNHQQFNFGKVLQSGAEQAGVMSLAASTGYKLTPAKEAPVVSPRDNVAKTSSWSQEKSDNLPALEQKPPEPNKQLGSPQLMIESAPSKLAIDAPKNLAASRETELQSAQKWHAEAEKNRYDQKAIQERYGQSKPLPFEEARHIPTLLANNKELPTNIHNAFGHFANTQVTASIDSTLTWANNNPNKPLTPAIYKELLDSDLHKAHSWYEATFKHTPESMPHSLDYAHARLLQVLWQNDSGNKIENLTANLSAKSQRASIEAAAVVDWLKANPERNMTESDFDALPFRNIYKSANLMDSLNAEAGAGRQRPEGPYPLTPEEMELARYVSSIDSTGGRSIFSEFSKEGEALQQAFENRGIEAARFSGHVMNWHQLHPSESLTPAILDSFMKDPVIQDGRVLDAIMRKDPSALQLPAGDLAITKDEVDVMTRLAQRQRHFRMDWCDALQSRGIEAGWLARKARDWYYEHDGQAVPAQELTRLGRSDTARALRLLDDLHFDRNRARESLPGNSPISLTEAHLVQALARYPGFSHKLVNKMENRSIAAATLTSEIADLRHRKRGSTEPDMPLLTPKLLDDMSSSKNIETAKLLDALKDENNAISKVQAEPYAVTLDEANLTNNPYFKARFVAEAFGHRSLEARRFIEIQRKSSECDPIDKTIDVEQWTRIGLAAKNFQNNAAEYDTPGIQLEWMRRSAPTETEYNLTEVMATSEKLPPNKWQPYFETWSKLIATRPGEQVSQWVNPELLRSMAEILPADSSRYTGQELKGLYDHIEQTGIVPQMRNNELHTAIHAWANEPALPEQLAVTVGSMERRQWLASPVAWKHADGNETTFLKNLSDLNSVKDRDLLRMLTDVHSIPDAVELRFGDTLSAAEKATLSKTLLEQSAANTNIEADGTNNSDSLSANQPFKVLVSMSPKAFSNALAATEKTGEADARSALAGALTFKGSFPQWLSMQSKYERNLHDATYWLPMRPGEDQSGLGQTLIKNGNKRLVDLERIARDWPELEAGVREQLNAGNMEQVVQELRSRSYPNHKDSAFANEAALWGVRPADYAKFEQRFIDSQKVPEQFPVDKRWQAGNLTGRFLSRKDPEGIFLGQHTNSCQHPYGLAKTSAWDGQENPNSGFFVVENARDEIVAMSWVYKSSNGGVVFDNVEAKGIQNRMTNVQDIYQKAADSLASKYKMVTLGTSMGDLTTNRWEETVPQPLPTGYTGYSDAKTQVLLAKAEY